MTSEQITEWQAYDTLDPVGTWRDDFRIAQVLTLIDNITKSLYGKKGETKQSSYKDFMPDFGKRKKVRKQKEFKQTLEEQKEAVLRIARLCSKDSTQRKRKR